MRTTTNPLTLDEHRELGREVRATRARLRQLCGLVMSVYGPANTAAFAFQRAADAMDRLCGDLQAQASADHPGHPVDGFYE
jgi:hypothetical protein